ncbi:MAG: peptidoglycan bridge formation glycyltransferase FemA/FemB family protein [Candidatus Daviesbacteria bacterium]|nr:peptidoglycan bridge formation glycyltransferase FemA/FemB family protein [Candidatus Daviesbacteria bacterium]
MDLKAITEKQKNIYNKSVSHIMQSFEWGEFREKLGTKLKRYGLYENGKLKIAFQLTFHKIPLTNYFVGYLPKGPFPDKDLAEALKKIGKENNCAFIKVEPNVILSASSVIASEAKQSCDEIATSPSAPRNDNTLISKKFKESPKPLFTKFNYVLDLTKSEDEIMKNMHQKTRYNIKIAQKHGVKVEERQDDEAFKIYLKLYFETTKRQGYHGHNENYHQKAWEVLKKAGLARILVAFYQDEPLTTWMLFNFKDTLYYPYGGSSKTHPEVMTNNLVAWEAIKLGKRKGLKKFDMWGALGTDANPSDPWYGFHKFKQGYGGNLVEYLGTYDLIFNWPIYMLFNLIEKFMPLKILLLRLIRN